MNKGTYYQNSKTENVPGKEIAIAKAAGKKMLHGKFEIRFELALWTNLQSPKRIDNIPDKTIDSAVPIATGIASE
eukprot:c44094_g1_i1 orf=135-359(+)